METATMRELESQISFLHGLLARSEQRTDLDAKLIALEASRRHMLQADEIRWRLKSRATWISSGDSNSRFFHRFASHRRNKKLIWEIESENGRTVHSLDEIKQEAHIYYKKNFKEDHNFSIQDQADSAQFFPQMVTAAEARSLEAPCTLEEILQVLKGFKKEKIPGPDG